MQKLMNPVFAKRQSFQKEIRRQKLDAYFKTKRTLNFQNQNQNTFCEEKNLTMNDMLSEIQKKQNVYPNIMNLANVLATDEPFKRLMAGNDHPSQKQIQDFCDRLLQIILTQTFPWFQKQPKIKITCLTVVSNLFGDVLCNNSLYVKFFLEFIQNCYSSISEWGVDQEITQVAFTLGNLLKKNILDNSQRDIQRLLEWTQQAISQINDSYALCSLIIGVRRFFIYTDIEYNRQGKYLQTQHYRGSRQILVQLCFKQLKNTLEKGCLQALLEFIKENKVYVHVILAQNQQWNRILINKLMQIVASCISDSVTHGAMSLIIYLIEYIPQKSLKLSNSKNSRNRLISEQKQEAQKLTIINQNIFSMRSMIIRQFTLQLTHFIAQKSRSIKIMCLQLFQMLIDQQQKRGSIEDTLELSTLEENMYEICVYILKTKELEIVLLCMLNDVQNQDIILRICTLYDVILTAGKGKIGNQIFFKIEQVQEIKNNNRTISKELAAKIECIRHKFQYYAKSQS